jgi:hypothetical protein
MTLADWRDVSIILLALEAIVIGIIYGAAFYYFWKGVRIARAWLSTKGFPEGQRYTRLMKTYTNQYSKKIVRPVVKAEATVTRATKTVGTLASAPKQRTRR